MVPAVHSMQLRRYSTFLSGSPKVSDTEDRSVYWASVPVPPALQTSQVYPPSKLRSTCTAASHFSAASVKLAAASAPDTVMFAAVNPGGSNKFRLVPDRPLTMVPGGTLALLMAEPFARPVPLATVAAIEPIVVVRAVTTEVHIAKFIGPRNANGWLTPAAPKVPCSTAFA